MRELLPPAVEGSARIERPPLAKRAPRTKSRQTARAAHLPAAQHLRIGLSGQIDRQHRVDRDEVVDLADDPDVVRVADRREPQRRAAARPVVDPRAAERGGAHHGARVVRLARAGEYARLVQIGHLVADQPAVQAQIAPLAQRGEHGGRDLADADLNRVAVVDQAGDVRADPMGLRRQAAGRERDQRAFRLDHVVEPVVRDLIAVGRARHGGVDLGHDHLGPIQHRRDEVHRDAEAAAAAAIRRRDLDQGEIDLEPRQIAPDPAVVQRQEAHLAGRVRAGDVAEHEERGEAGVGVEGCRVDGD